MLRYLAVPFTAGFAVALSSHLFAGTLGDDLLLGSSALMAAGCAVMAVACAWDAVDEWKRLYGRSRT